MATDFVMPKLGLTMEEGTILAWLVPDGAQVEPGMAVMTIETDKVESDVEASGSGRLRQLGAQGQTFTCGAVIGQFLDVDEEPADPTTSPERPASTEPAAARSIGTDARPPTPTNGDRMFVSPNARRVAALRNVDLHSIRGTGPNGRIVSEDVDAAADRPATRPAEGHAVATHRPPASTAPHPATAAARQLADLLGVDLTEVSVDPIDGYITRECVARYVRARLQPPVPSAPAATQAPTSIRKLSGMRGTIAKRMHSSLQQMAQLTLMMDADMGAVIADRSARREQGLSLGYTDYVIAAAARALRLHPVVNSQVTAEGIALLPDVNVGFAVALDEGLLVPVIRNADQLDLTTLAAETSRLADAARSGSATLADLEGGTFSVSALGMLGVDAFTPVINPPNAAILGVGRMREDVVIVDGAVTTRTRMTLSLTWDHRVLDGAPAATFCKAIVELLADPTALQTSA